MVCTSSSYSAFAAFRSAVSKPSGIPQIATIVFLCMLGAAINLSTTAAVNFRARIRASDEIKYLGGGNLFCAFVGSPPGYTDAVTSTVYEELGASSRWMPIASSLVLFLNATGDLR